MWYNLMFQLAFPLLKRKQNSLQLQVIDMIEFIYVRPRTMYGHLTVTQLSAPPYQGCVCCEKMRWSIQM